MTTSTTHSNKPQTAPTCTLKIHQTTKDAALCNPPPSLIYKHLTTNFYLYNSTPLKTVKKRQRTSGHSTNKSKCWGTEFHNSQMLCLMNLHSYDLKYLKIVMWPKRKHSKAKRFIKIKGYRLRDLNTFSRAVTRIQDTRWRLCLMIWWHIRTYSSKCLSKFWGNSRICQGSKSSKVSCFREWK